MGLTSEEGNTTCPFQRLLSKRWSITQAYFQVTAVAIFEVSAIHTGHVQSIPVGFFSHMQFAWADNSVEDPMWIEAEQKNPVALCCQDKRNIIY